MKMPKPTKADLICGLLSYWDPLAFEGKAGPMFYNYEAEILAQSVRKNSKLENVAKKVREAMVQELVENVWVGDEITVEFKADSMMRIAEDELVG